MSVVRQPALSVSYCDRRPSVVRSLSWSVTLWKNKKEKFCINDFFVKKKKDGMEVYDAKE